MYLPPPSQRPILANAFVAVLLAVMAAGCNDDSPGVSSPDADSDAGDTASADVEEDLRFDVPFADADDTDTASTEDTTPTPDTEPDAPDDDTATDAAVDTGPPPRCSGDDECDDGRDCTIDACGDGGFCVWEIEAGTCLLGGVCYEEGQARPGDACAVCEATAPSIWTPLGDGAPCDDGDVCTADTTCLEGACSGAAIDCEDRNPCTENACDPVLGCVFPAEADGTPCEDGSACTEADACLDSACVGAPVDCDDLNGCTDDTCDPELGCSSTPNASPCEDGDACTTDDVCADGTCVAGGPTNCEDGNTCTIDVCDDIAGCVYLPNLNPCCSGTVSICDDLDPCTTDICNPADGSCSTESNTARCDDGNACTTSDTCADRACVGREEECVDSNPCTADSCDEETGCTFEPLDDTPCDDGVACTIDDVCRAGICEAGRSECVCDPTFGLQALKLTSLRIGSGGHPGEALDLDADPSTCAPAADCSGGRHNALGVIGPFANDSLAGAVADGSMMLILDIDDISLNPFEFSFVQADLSPDDSGCDFQAEECRYVADPGSYDPETCEPVVRLPATRSGLNVTAGGPGTVFPFEVPFGEGATLSIILFDVRFEGTLAMDGDAVTGLTGVLGGAVSKAALLEALDALPADSLPIDRDAVASLLELLVQNDIDTDGDGEPDAASIGIPITGIGASLVGVATD